MKETSLEPVSTIKPLNAASARSVHPGIRALNFIVDMFIWFVLAFISVILLDHLLPTLNHFTINAIAYSVMAALFLAYHTISRKQQVSLSPVPKWSARAGTDLHSRLFAAARCSGLSRSTGHPTSLSVRECTTFYQALRLSGIGMNSRRF